MKPVLSPRFFRGLAVIALFYVLIAGVVLLVMLAIAEGGVR